MNRKDYGRIRLWPVLRYCTNICLEENVCQDKRPPAPDLNPVHPEHETQMTTQPQFSAQSV